MLPLKISMKIFHVYKILKYVLELLTGKIYGSCCCLQEENWFQRYNFACLTWITYQFSKFSVIFLLDTRKLCISYFLFVFGFVRAWTFTKFMMFSSSICLQELYLSSPSLKNLQSTSMLYIYGLNSSFIFKDFHLLLNIYNCRYDWDAATAANFLRQHGLIGAPSRLGKFPYIPHWDNTKFHFNIFYLFSITLFNRWI